MGLSMDFYMYLVFKELCKKVPTTRVDTFLHNSLKASHLRNLIDNP